eukprot:scaffold4782_cov106-Cylindrotheca_fusiformis.AAC.1
MEMNNTRNEMKGPIMMKTTYFGIAFGCCLLCCLLPGAVMLPIAIVAKNDYEEATGVVVKTTLCNSRRRRRLLRHRNMMEETEVSSAIMFSFPTSGTSSILPAHQRRRVKTGPGSYNAKDYPEYSVTYTYETADGEQVQGTTSYCSTSVPQVGSTDIILYDPTDTSRVVEKSQNRALRSTGLGMLIIGAVALCGIGLCFFVFHKKKKKNPPAGMRNDRPPKNTRPPHYYNNNNNGNDVQA